MRRRDFITLLGGSAAAWPMAAGAEQARKVPTIGFLGASTSAFQAKWTAAFEQRLHELGWTKGRTVAIEYRWAEGQKNRGAEWLAEFLRMKVDLIVTHGTPFVLAAKRASSVIPIVFPVASSPVENGVVASLARPGGNVTGLSLQRADTAAKRVELLREIFPRLRGLAILVNADSPGVMLEADEVRTASQVLGLSVVRTEIRRAADIAPAFEGFKGRVNALYVAAEPLVFVNRGTIATLAVASKLPTMYGLREYVDAGGLASYGPNFADLFRRAADFVDKILRGAKPADIPVEQPTKFDLVINLTTAKAIGLTIPPMLLALADDVIE